VHTYRLRFLGDDVHPSEEIEFEAEDAHDALVLAHDKARRRSAELWRDDEMLCSIRRAEPGFWIIESAARRRSANVEV
jgi:hypothetical protein